MMEVIETQVDATAIVEVRGRIDSTTASGLQQRLQKPIESGLTGIVVDFSQVQYISSAGFKALLIAAKLGEKSGCSVALCGVVGEIRRMFEIAAFDQVFTILDTREACVRHLAASRT
jgi:anti-sigma B factor antagonist